MCEKYCCVIDASRRYITYVLVLVDEQGMETIQNYTLKEDELLIDAKPPVYKAYAGTDGLIKPVWNETESVWAEGATDAEIYEWESDHPKHPIPGPSQLDRIEAQTTYTAMMTDTLLEE